MCADRVRFGILGGTFDPVHLGHIASASEIARAFALTRVLLVLSARPPHKTAGEAAPAADRWQMLELAAAKANASSPDVIFEPCDIEMRRDAPSWTVDTLKEIAGRHPHSDLFLILGADAYAEIDSWSRPGEIPALANIIVTTRPGWPVAAGTDASRDANADVSGIAGADASRDARADVPVSAADRRGHVHDEASPPLPPVAAREDARYDPAIGVYVHTSGHTIHGHRIRGIEVSSSEIRSRVRRGLPVEHLTGDAVARYIHQHRLYADGGTPTPAGSAKSSQGAGKD
ncbi:MAG TPA: nicotinate-nucleotide adenylyltransferase [Candidatus Limnocylindrales bacterium]|nr:nicotinate-nucleotide adenylyltransferase [Candidatus Limnocylindrales bacterium]